MNSQPIQPLHTDKEGILRFKQNAIVRYLLDNGGIDLNKIAMLEFSVEDQEQFAQLIGYSLSGFGDLPYVTNETWHAASLMNENGISEQDAKIRYLEDLLDQTRTAFKALVPKLFRIAEEDLI